MERRPIRYPGTKKVMRLQFFRITLSQQVKSPYSDLFPIDNVNTLRKTAYVASIGTDKLSEQIINAALAAYGVFLLLPAALNLGGEVRWRCSLSNI